METASESERILYNQVVKLLKSNDKQFDVFLLKGVSKSKLLEHACYYGCLKIVQRLMSTSTVICRMVFKASIGMYSFYTSPKRTNDQIDIILLLINDGILEEIKKDVDKISEFVPSVIGLANDTGRIDILERVFCCIKDASDDEKSSKIPVNRVVIQFDHTIYPIDCCLYPTVCKWPIIEFFLKNDSPLPLSKEEILKLDTSPKTIDNLYFWKTHSEYRNKLFKSLNQNGTHLLPYLDYIKTNKYSLFENLDLVDRDLQLAIEIYFAVMNQNDDSLKEKLKQQFGFTKAEEIILGYVRDLKNELSKYIVDQVIETIILTNHFQFHEKKCAKIKTNKLLKKV
jgi:hypothetical protein